MAYLTPNSTYVANGVKVYEKIIPDGAKWNDAKKAKAAGFAKGELYKKQQKLSGGTGKVKWITIHNTADLDNVHDDAEQYTRATFNENMLSTRVHYYVDNVCAWQNLKAGTGEKHDPVGSAEVGWHAGDGSDSDGGNMTSIAIEIIMGSKTAGEDAKAKDNGARLAAWLLWKHGLTLDKLVSHTYWVNKSAGIGFADPDAQSTNMIAGKKWCPTFIFASNNEDIALKNWRVFKSLVKKYLDDLKKVNATVSASKKRYYVVRAGTFSHNNRAGADETVRKLKAAGFDAYVEVIEK